MHPLIRTASLNNLHENQRDDDLSFLHKKYNVSVNNTTLYFIYNKNSVLSGRHVSTFIRSTSDPWRNALWDPKWDPTMH